MSMPVSDMYVSIIVDVHILRVSNDSTLVVSGSREDMYKNEFGRIAGRQSPLV